MKKLTYYLVIIIAIICFFMAKFNFEKVKQFENMIDISFLENLPNEQVLKNILEENNDIIEIIGISNSGFVNIKETNYNRNEDAKLLKIFGNPQKVFFYNDILYKTYFEKNGVFLSNSLAYSLFKSENVLGNKIEIDKKEYIICGIFKDKEPVLIIKNNSNDKFNNIKVFFNKTQSISMNIEKFIRTNNFNNIYLNNISLKVSILLIITTIPKILLFLLFIYTIYKVLKFKEKYTLKSIIYKFIVLIIIIIFFFILNISIKIPVDFIPNKWSDFEFYKNIFISFMNNIANYIQIDKSLLYINIDKYFYIILINIFICTICMIIINIFNLSNKLKN